MCLVKLMAAFGKCVIVFERNILSDLRRSDRKVEDTKGVKRIGKSKDRQYNGLVKKEKNTNNILHNITQKTKD